MLELAVVSLRWFQYSGAVVVLGLPLFLLYSLRSGDRPNVTGTRPALLIATLVVALGSLGALVAQTAIMAGSLTEAVKPASLSFMVTGTALGMAMVLRAGVALLGLMSVIALKPGRALHGLMVAAGLIIAASFAWTGHGAATDGTGGLVHLTADIIHSVAAALWLGALVALTILLFRRTEPDDEAMHRALHGFAGLGTLAVVLLVLTGLVNSWLLVGLSRVGDLGTSLYGQLLIAKLVLFALMLALAAKNRFRLTPALGAALAGGIDPRLAFQRLRHSIVAETLAGALLLGLVALMGTLAPPSAM